MKLRIGPHDWTVKRSRKALNAACYESCDRVDGYTDPETYEITVSKVPNLQRQREVMLHEVLHAAVIGAGLSDILGKREESVVNRFTKVLLPALRDNPKLVEFLLA